MHKNDGGNLYDTEMIARHHRSPRQYDHEQRRQASRGGRTTRARLDDGVLRAQGIVLLDVRVALPRVREPHVGGVDG